MGPAPGNGMLRRGIRSAEPSPPPALGHTVLWPRVALAGPRRRTSCARASATLTISDTTGYAPLWMRPVDARLRYGFRSRSPSLRRQADRPVRRHLANQRERERVVEPRSFSSTDRKATHAKPWIPVRAMPSSAIRAQRPSLLPAKSSVVAAFITSSVRFPFPATLNRRPQLVEHPLLTINSWSSRPSLASRPPSPRGPSSFSIRLAREACSFAKKRPSSRPKRGERT